MAELPKPKPVESNMDDFGFDTKEFTVAVNSKTFKILIDGLYTNKIQSIIRELSTNAYDAHLMAGCPERPFKVTLPTALDPVFSIRDYGVSIAHPDVMEMYVKLFESTKDESNEQVGAFGLGSKSPFSYTDSFSVKAYQDGMVRSYVVGYNSKGIPTITHILTEESDEEQGFEVSFPTQYKDYLLFRQEAFSVLRHFPTQPIVNEITFNQAEPLMAKNDWKVYGTNEIHTGSKINIRQGCVVYPVSIYGLGFEGLGYTCSVIIDVPIGSVNVVASREALSLDEQTTDFIKRKVKQVSTEILLACLKEIDGAPTVWQACKAYSRLSVICPGMNPEYKRPGMKKAVDFKGGVIRIDAVDPKLPTMSPYSSKSHAVSGGKWWFRPVDVEHYKFIVDRNEKLVRRQIRLKAFAGMQKERYWILHNPTPKQLARLVRRFELRADQIVSITSLPDIPPAPKGRVEVGSKSGLYKGTFGAKYLTKCQDSDIVGPYYWLPIDKPKGPILEGVFNNVDCDNFLQETHSTLMFLGITARPVFLMTKNAVKRNNPNPDDRLDTVVKLAAEPKRSVVKEYVAAIELTRSLGVASEMLAPNEWKIRQKANIAYTHNRFRDIFYREINNGEEILQRIRQIKDKYPLVFPHPPKSAIEEYINLVNSKEKR